MKTLISQSSFLYCTTSPADLRRTQRIPCSRPVRLRTSEDRELSALCTDLNATGIGLDSDAILKVGQRVDLLLDDHSRIPLLVIYRMGQHYGLSALGSPDRLMQLLPLQ